MLRHLFNRSKPDVLFLSSSPIDEVWTRTTALACHASGLRVEVAICADADAHTQRLLAPYAEQGIRTHDGISFANAAKINSRIAVTASSGLDRNIFPTRAGYFIHMPHSLASLHMIYPAGAFDGYDMLFEAGPQHAAEYAAITGQNRATPKPSYAIGYGKLDVLQQVLDLRATRTSARPLVLIAPSWGGDNLLDNCGVALAKALVAQGCDVVVRPHPLFFLDKAPVLEVLQTLAQEQAGIHIESPFAGDDAIFDADILVGDYSGISFEFAALHRRPVVSVNVGLKIANPEWQMFDLEPVEIACRALLGPVVPADVDAIVTAVRSALGRAATPDAAIASFLHGKPGHCGALAATAIKNILTQN